MMEDDEGGEWDTGPTIEEIISSVVKRKSKFGLSSGRLPPRPSSTVKKNQNREGSSSPENNELPKSKTVSLNSNIQRSLKAESKTSSSVLGTLHSASALPSHERLSPVNAEKVPSESLEYKMQSYHSTPEVSNQLMECQQPSSARKPLHVTPNKHIIGEKENKRPNFVPLEVIGEREQETFKLASKTPCQEANATCPDNSNTKDFSLGSKVNVQNAVGFVRNNIRTPQQQNSSVIAKRELAANTKDCEGNVRPAKIPNVSCSPIRLPSQSLKVSNLACAPEENNPRAVSEAHQFLEARSQPVSSTRENRLSGTSTFTENQLTALNVQEANPELRNVQYSVSKGVHQPSPKEGNSTHSHQVATDNGYVTGNMNGNVLQASSNAQGHMTPSLQTPSEHREGPRPPTPPTNHKLKKMDNIEVNGHQYLKLGIIGRGGSSKVYEVLDVESCKVKAIKIVELEGLDVATLKSYENEIEILKRLQWSDRVIKLHDFENNGEYLKLVMEKGNQDMAAVLSSTRGAQRAPISPFTIKHYWHGMLLACQAIHNEGIIHSDLKPANFVLVNQTVKLIDFGIASSIQQDMTSVIKDSQAGTFNYMSPESTMDVHTGPVINKLSGDKVTIKIGVKSDVWSLGCILYNLVYGRTPFQHISNPLKKLAAISDPNFRITFKEIEDKQLEEVMRLCLQFEPRRRPSIHQLLQHPYLTDKNQSSDSSTPAKPAHIKSAIDQLVQLTPNSLNKITSMMKQMKHDS